MAPVPASNFSTANYDIKQCQVILFDIFSGVVNFRKRKDEKVDKDESGSDEEAPTVVKKRIVKIISDKNEDKENSDGGKADDSDYEVKDVKPIKKEMEFKPKHGGNYYERLIEKKRAERIELLKSMEIDKIKNELFEALGGIKQLKKRRNHKKPAPELIRRSKRLAKIDVDINYSKNGKALKNTSLVVDRTIPPEISFEEALTPGSTYEECVRDLSIQEPKSNQKFISYDASVLKNMTLHEFNACKVVPTCISSAAWYPSKENLVVAAGDRYGHVGLWQIQDSESKSHVFKSHADNISYMQFCSFYPADLITASFDGTLKCSDLINHTINEIYVSNGSPVTWFDFMSPSTFLISHLTGEVALFDRKTKGKTCGKIHACHDCAIRTISVHPLNKNVFITADMKRNIRLWDLRKLQKTPVVEISHHTKSVNSAYFSPVTGNSILSTSLDDSISIFDSSKLTENINFKIKIRHINLAYNRSTFKATWLPNSDDMFSIGSMENPRRIEIYDKDLTLCLNVTDDNLTAVTTVNCFHPYRSAIAGGNSTGKLYVFT